jgi:type IV pilus assembly protein PilX
MMTQPHPLPTTNAPQEGFVLIVGLVILGLLTMLALSSMRDTTMQEKMAGASRDSGLAFQAAESALRDAENCITGTTAGCTFDPANDAHFTRDDKEFPGHNTLFNATTWDAIDPPGEPTTLAGDPALNYIIRQASIVSGDAGGGKGADVGTRDYSKSKEKSSQAIYEITARGAGASGVGQSVLRVYYRK